MEIYQWRVNITAVSSSLAQESPHAPFEGRGDEHRETALNSFQASGIPCI